MPFSFTTPSVTVNGIYSAVSLEWDAMADSAEGGLFRRARLTDLLAADLNALGETLAYLSARTALTIDYTTAAVAAARGGVQLAISRGAEIKYDYTAQAPWFNYTDAAGCTHVVWFEDARSVIARLQLVGEYSLAGISIWTADKVYRPGLYALQSMYSVEKLL